MRLLLHSLRAQARSCLLAFVGELACRGSPAGWITSVFE